MVARRPDIDMSPEEELRARYEALEGAVQAATAARLRDPYVEHLREVIGSRWNEFRRGLRRGYLPARVEPLRVALKAGARPFKARPRVYNPIKTAWVPACMASFAGACFPQYAGCVGQCSHGYAKKRGISHGD